MVGTYFKCDSCETIHYGDIPGLGWIGLTRVTSVSGDPRLEPLGSVPRAEVSDQHACSAPCAQRLLMSVVLPATVLPQ